MTDKAVKEKGEKERKKERKNIFEEHETLGWS